MADKRKSPFITSGERVRNFLLAAFGLSLLLHIVAVPFFPTLGAHKEDQTVEKVSVTKKTKIKVPTPPPPTPTPRPTPTPQAHSTPPPKTQTQPQPKLKLNVPKTNSNSSSSSNQSKYVPPKTGSENGVPSGQGTPAVSKPAPPAATVGPPATAAPPACRTPYQDATSPNQVPPDYPEAARSQGLGPVTVLVQVTISPSGSLQGAKIYQSSNNMSIDQSALSAARQSTYSPKIVACKPVEGTYLFRAQFDPNQ